MQTPYEILGVVNDANDNDIKQAYLQQVKNNPPDRNQDQFQCIHNAYISIKDRKSRVSHDLFSLPTANFNTVLEQIMHTEQSITLDAESFNKILSVSIDEANLLSSFSRSERS